MSVARSRAAYRLSVRYLFSFPRLVAMNTIQTGAADIPAEILEIIRSAAPTWSTSVWEARE
jgi:hypothetical protein